MEDLAVFTVLNHSGSFGKNFVELKKKNVIYRLRSVRMVKNCFFFFFQNRAQSRLLYLLIIIKFRYNYLCHWLKERALGEYRA